MSKVMLAMGLVVTYGYFMEIFIAWYSGSEYEWAMIMNRFHGPYAVTYWALIACNCVIPQLLWFRRYRTNTVALWILSIVINIGMWLERFVIIVVSLNRDFLPSSWHMYYPSLWDWAMYLGTFGLFFTLLFLFVRFLPVISITEMRELVHHEASLGGHGGGAGVTTTHHHEGK
jgi:molybdopterin-containing oxidoreductase family membrane subunit